MLKAPGFWHWLGQTLYYLLHKVFSVKHPRAFCLAVVRAHTVITTTMTPCRWMLVLLHIYHATIWQTSGRRLLFESTIWLFPAINLMQEGVWKLPYQTVLLHQFVYLCGFAAPVLQVKRLYESVFWMTTCYNLQLCFFSLCSDWIIEMLITVCWHCECLVLLSLAYVT